MATLSSSYMTLADYARRLGPDGSSIPQVINILSQSNKILEDMLVREGNSNTGHVSTIRTGLPSATWRLLNYGVQPTKSTTAQVTDTCGFLETFSDIDQRLAEMNGLTAELRLQEDAGFLEGMNQQMASAMFYSNALSSPGQIMGLSPRYNTVSTSTAQSAYNVIDAGGTGSTNTSIWVVVWKPGAIFTVYPKGGVGAGLKHVDMGLQPFTDSSGTRYVYRSQFRWDIGLVVADWRFAVRVCNIDTTQLLTGNAPNLLNYLARATERIPAMPSSATLNQTADTFGGVTVDPGRAAIYCNRTIQTALKLQAMNKPNNFLSFETVSGRPVAMFEGIPIRTVDQLLNTEARVV